MAPGSETGQQLDGAQNGGTTSAVMTDTAAVLIPRGRVCVFLPAVGDAAPEFVQR